MICRRCGHPNMDTGHYMPHPDPSRLCAAIPCVRCEKNLVYESHHWNGWSEKEKLCCGCYCYYRDNPDAAPAIADDQEAGDDGNTVPA